MWLIQIVAETDPFRLNPFMEYQHVLSVLVKPLRWSCHVIKIIFYVVFHVIRGYVEMILWYYLM